MEVNAAATSAAPILRQRLMPLHALLLLEFFLQRLRQTRANLRPVPLSTLLTELKIDLREQGVNSPNEPIGVSGNRVVGSFGLLRFLNKPHKKTSPYERVFIPGLQGYNQRPDADIKTLFNIGFLGIWIFLSKAR